jgi:hypothetical protein
MKPEPICLLFVLLACATGTQSAEPSATRRKTAYTEEQKRDMFYSNAVKFFRLKEPLN